MSHHPFQAFVALISLDQEIRAIHQEITQRQQNNEKYFAEKQHVTDRLQKFKQHVHDLRKQVDAQELEMEELNQQEKTQKEHLDVVKNIKGHNAFKKEIDRLKRAQQEAEATLMTIWNKLEIAQKELTEQQTSYDAKIAELHTLTEQQQEKVAVLHRQLEKKKKERPEKEVGIPQDWLTKYSHMRMQIENPVVPVEQGSCSACSYTIPQQELMRLHRRSLAQCKGCFRLLYAPEAMDTQVDHESAAP